MLGNFSYYNPTKLYFGDESLNLEGRCDCVARPLQVAARLTVHS